MRLEEWKKKKKTTHCKGIAIMVDKYEPELQLNLSEVRRQGEGTSSIGNGTARTVLDLDLINNIYDNKEYSEKRLQGHVQH